MMEETNKIRWGDIKDDDNNFDCLLPAKQVIRPNEDGIKKVIEYKFNDEGKTVKVTTTVRVRKENVRVSRRATERHTWDRFGDAVHDDPGGGGFTAVSREDIFLERPKAYGTKPEEPKSDLGLGKGGVMMVCRNCGKKGDHWTARCPMSNNLSLTDQVVPSKHTTQAGTNSYVPPNKRDEKIGIVVSDTRRRNDENSVRVTNLSEDTREADLMDLFGTFGSVTRAYVALDQKTGMSRGFGFVNFLRREDGQVAINKLDGYGYDNLILRVEWAAPRP